MLQWSALALIFRLLFMHKVQSKMNTLLRNCECSSAVDGVIYLKRVLTTV